MKYDLNIINQYVEEGWIIANNHRTLPLIIYNYSRQTQFERKWDEITLACRGLVLDLDGNVVAKPFGKFFNMEELSEDLIPNLPFETFEKMDGSLGILFYYGGEWHMATRGSFTSDQAIKGMEILKANYPAYITLSPKYTYLFEIIYPENRIVVNYNGEEKLVLLGCINNENGEEHNIHTAGFEEEGFDIVKKYPYTNVAPLLKYIIEENSEGFVLRYTNGFRIKVKGDEYCRLHSLLTNFSNVDIWKVLMTDSTKLHEFLDRVPDEFDAWVKNTVKDLRYRFHLIKEDAGKRLDNYRENYDYTLPERKKVAEWVNTQPHHLRSIIFRMLDGKNYDELIWKLLRPVYSKPFWNRDLEA